MNDQANTENVTKDIRMLLWNVRSLRRIKEEIPKLLENLDILICLETRLDPVSVSPGEYRYPGFVTYRQDRNNAGGSLAIFVRSNLAYTEIVDLVIPDDRIEMCALKFNNVYPEFTLFACYRPPGFRLSQAKWKALISNLDNHSNVLLVGDFNSHHTSWNCRKTLTNGARFCKAVTDKDLHIRNTDTLSHLYTQSLKIKH